VEVAADSAYCNDTVTRGLPVSVVLFGAMRPDAVLTQLPVAKAPGSEGRPCKRGRPVPEWHFELSRGTLGLMLVGPSGSWGQNSGRFSYPPEGSSGQAQFAIQYQHAYVERIIASSTTGDGVHTARLYLVAAALGPSQPPECSPRIA